MRTSASVRERNILCARFCIDKMTHMYNNIMTYMAGATWMHIAYYTCVPSSGLILVCAFRIILCDIRGLGAEYAYCCTASDMSVTAAKHVEHWHECARLGRRASCSFPLGCIHDTHTIPNLSPPFKSMQSVGRCMNKICKNRKHSRIIYALQMFLFGF